MAELCEIFHISSSYHRNHLNKPTAERSQMMQGSVVDGDWFDETCRAVKNVYFLKKLSAFLGVDQSRSSR